MVLCAELRRMRLKFSRNVPSLPGKPDIVFVRQQVAVFCDGDFWHGRKWNVRKGKLARGSNAEYWVAKIEANIARDRRHRSKLRRAGWRVIRLWESDILRDPEVAAGKVLDALVLRQD
jgi:DNA mismatch endonuclease Vsr